MTKAYILQGEANYAKILGAAPPGYDNGPAEWTFDLILNEDQVKDYLASGADKFYVKTNKESGAQYVKFTRKATKQDGEAAKPISVFGPDNKEWDQKVLIGNGSILNVKYTLNEAKYKGTKRLKPSVLAVQVWTYKPYVGKSSFPTKPSEAAEGEVQAW